MNINIEEKTKKTCLKCHKNFECLSDLKCCCAVEDVSEEVFFVNGKKLDCNYSFYFGNSKVCTCPARHEIYKKYKI